MAFPAAPPAARQERESPQGLSNRLSHWADLSPRAIAFRDQADRQAWSGRPPITWTYETADRVVSRLAGALRALGLPAGSSVLVMLPGGAEASLAYLAIERAGLLPCLLPVTSDQEVVVRALEAVRARLAVSQGRVASLRPAQILGRAAGRYFGIRFVAAFGPSVPDGVIDLDRVIVEGDGAPALHAPPAGVVTFRDPLQGRDPVHRSAAALMAEAGEVLAAAPVRTGERVLSLLAPDDIASLATGLGAALLSGAGFDHHGLFSAPALDRALGLGPTRLVAPGWMEEALSGAAVPAAAFTLVHRQPLPGGPRPLRGRVTDVLAVGETAVVAAERRADGHPAPALGPMVP